MTHPAIHDLPTRFRRLCLLGAIVLLSGGSSWANPIELPEPSVTPVITLLVIVSLLVEIACILVLLRRWRRPRFFILWLIGMHLLTYPAFLSLLWFLQGMRPAFAVAIGEGLAVVIEGALIYAICRLLPSRRPELATASVVRCLLASLAGNVCSAAAFPILLAIHDRLVHA